jgi:hypothetical protein
LHLRISTSRHCQCQCQCWHSLSNTPIHSLGVVAHPWRAHHTPIETRSNPRPTGVPLESKVDQVFSALSSTYHSHWILVTLTSCCRALRAARRPPLVCENPSVRTVLGWRSGVPWYPPPRIPRQCTSSAILVVQLIIDQGCAWATDQEYT